MAEKMYRRASNQDGRLYDYLCENPYDSFMKKHLQHYGYYTGKNELYRKTLEQWADYEKNYAVVDSSSSDSEFVNEALNTDKDRSDDLLRTTQVVYSLQAGRMVARLREPPELFAMPGSAQQQPAKWPIELEVLPETVTHIEYVPDAPEPLYSATGFEPTPMARTEENGGRIVFNYEPLLGPFFLRSRIGGNRNGCRVASVPIESETDQTLIFESRFESGNLERAIQTGPFEYDLYLRHDLYTNKHTQWYYFRVSNTRANRMYRFTIVNFYKSDSLYNQGMRPLMYSCHDAEQRKVGWRRWGGNIKYYRNNLKYETNRGERPFYSLTWTCVLPHDKDTVYFSHCYPYTYGDQQKYLLDLYNDPVRSRICKQRVLCRTLAGNFVYLLTITSETSSPEEARSKRAVVLSGRVHPGETNASWMMKGFLDYLTGPSPDAKLLRDNFIFKVVPILNPDGVIVGNYRCSLAGRDLNRNYKSVLKESFPSVWHTKNMIKKLMQEREVVMYCDLHGHSRKQNVFIYGCEGRESNGKRLQERIFPAMLSKNAPDKFHFESCKFKVQKSKESTGRVVMWNLGIDNSFTMEATFCGSNLEDKDGYHFSSADFEKMGYHFCDTLLDFCDPVDTKLELIRLELEDRLRHEILIRLQQRQTGVSPSLDDIDLDDIDLSDASLSDVESSDGGSDSSVSDGLPVHYEYMKAQLTPQKKKKSKKKDPDAKKKSDSRENACAPHANCTKSYSDVANINLRRSSLTRLRRDLTTKTRSAIDRKYLLLACSQSQTVPATQQQSAQSSQKDSRPISKRIPMRRAASTTNALADARQNFTPPGPPAGATGELLGTRKSSVTQNNGLTDQLIKKVEEQEETSRINRNPTRNVQMNGSNQNNSKAGPPVKYSYSVQAQTGLRRASAFASTEPTALIGTENLCAQHEHQLHQHLTATQEIVRHETEQPSAHLHQEQERPVVQLQRNVRSTSRMVGGSVAPSNGAVASSGATAMHETSYRPHRVPVQRPQRIDASLPSRMQTAPEHQPFRTLSVTRSERPPSGKAAQVASTSHHERKAQASAPEKKVVEKHINLTSSHPAVTPSPDLLRRISDPAVELTAYTTANSPAVPRATSARRTSESNLQLANILENLIKSQSTASSESAVHYQSAIPPPTSAKSVIRTYKKSSDRPTVTQMLRESRSDGVEMTNTLASIREIRQSLNDPSTSGNISPSTRDHVEQLLAAADREIEQISAGTTNVESSLQMAGYKFTPDATRSGQQPPRTPVAPVKEASPEPGLAALPPAAQPMPPTLQAERAATAADTPTLARANSEPESITCTPGQRPSSIPSRRPATNYIPDPDNGSLGVVGTRQEDAEVTQRSRRMLEQLRGARRSSQQTKTKVGRVNKQQQELGKEENLRQRAIQASISELTLPTKISLVMDEKFGRPPGRVIGQLPVRSAHSSKPTVRNAPPPISQSPQPRFL